MTEIDKDFLMKAFFEDLNKKIRRAETLGNSKEYFLEGMLVSCCHIEALAKDRYPEVENGWERFKKIVENYAKEQKDIWENIDLLFFYQCKTSKEEVKKYCKEMKNYDELLRFFKEKFGDENNIKKDASARYQKRNKLAALIKDKTPPWFDEKNFLSKIGRFSNLQILRDFIRNALVHEMYSNLIKYDDDEHQITRSLVLDTLKNISKNLEKECLQKCRWPQELDCPC